MTFETHSVTSPAETLCVDVALPKGVEQRLKHMHPFSWPPFLLISL